MAGCPHPAHALKTVVELQTASSLLENTRLAKGRLSAREHPFFIGKRNGAVFAQRRRGAEDSVTAGLGTPRTPKTKNQEPRTIMSFGKPA
jgi:hypothetical protein